MTSADTRTIRAESPPPTGRSAFRPDIEGLRAVAIGLVLIYHAGVRFLPGGFVGVDVFFVISGFLITGLLIRELEKQGKISLPRFYARRAKRLLPATGVVLLATAALTWWSTSAVDWRTFGWDIVGASVYVVNWVFAGRAVDYLAEDVGASPVQHFWSLAVEEQFYIVWPLLLVAVAWLVRRRARAALRPMMTLAILLVIVPSLAWSIHLSTSSPDQAFFVTTTRLWELGIGALVAIGATQWHRVPPRLSAATGWLGLAAIVASGFVITAETTWPGYAALLPTLGTAAVIVSGYVPGGGPAQLLSWRPAVWIGGLSYSLYLWHWPLLTAATAMWGDLGAKRGLLVVAIAFVPSYLSLRFVENPIRFSGRVSRSNTLALSMGANFSLVGVIAGIALVLAVPSSAPAEGSAAGATDIEQPADAASAGPGSVASLADVTTIVPAPVDAPEDVPVGYADDCTAEVTGTRVTVCEYGDLDGEITVAVVGDSKIFQWQSALDTIAADEGWHLVYYLKSACAFSSALQVAGGEVNDTCADWNDAVLEEITELQPDAVLTSQRHGVAPTSAAEPARRYPEPMVDGLVDVWAQLASQDIPVVAILDNPSPSLEVYECVADNPTDLARCTFDRDTAVADSAAPTQLAAAARVPTVRTIDMADWICPAEQCVPVIGDVLVYRQGSHLTDTYVRSLAPALSDELVPIVAELTSPA